MSVKERVANRHQFKNDTFRIVDPEHGPIPVSVREIQSLPNDSPVWGYQIVDQYEKEKQIEENPS